VTSRINEQDHVKPGVIFPAILTVRDVTANLFRYVLNNVLRTRHYGAQTTRTGAMMNHVVAVVLTDREIFSNLRFTQRLYDTLQTQDAIHPPDPLDVPTALASARALVPELLREDGVAEQILEGAELETLLEEMRAANGDEVRQRLRAAFDDSRAYYERWIARARRR